MLGGVSILLVLLGANAVSAKRIDIEKVKNRGRRLSISESIGDTFRPGTYVCGTPDFKVVPYSTIGTRMTAEGIQKDLAAPLDLSMVIVDPAGRYYMEEQEPEEAGG